MAKNVFLLLAAAIIFFTLENLWPLRPRTQKLFTRLTVNGTFALFTFLIATFALKPLISESLSFSGQMGIGLLPHLELPPSVETIIAFLLFDLSFYYWHLLNHRVPWLWRFHLVHHIDPDLDVSSALRFHFVEIVYSLFFRCLQILVIGPSIAILLLYELIFQVATYFQHSNWRLPLRLEKILCLFIVTPRMHGFHHTQSRACTEANFSVVLSIWDRLHGTFFWHDRPQELPIGVPGYARPEDNRLLALMRIPFEPQRTYWP